MLGVEEAGLEIEPGMELDAPLEAPAGRSLEAGAVREMGLERRLDRGPMKLRVMVAADDVKTISLLEKTGERVEDRSMTLDGLAQLPDALRFLGGQPELPFFFGHFEGRFGPGRHGDGDEIDDVAVQEQTPRLSVPLVQGVEVEEFRQLGIEGGAPLCLDAGLQIAAQVEIGDREEVVRSPLVADVPPHSSDPHAPPMSKRRAARDVRSCCNDLREKTYETDARVHRPPR